ncbi:Inositol phosphatase SIW14 [Emydomyces testavorans]|uniref:ER membrane protein complex subunit 2 n=1 Tax=Emydomyces testavorans TaxID=2070801 RepID=A0AAF0DKJ4_9EURO|nr:Inositol phosphatase SIW14 [Emydomyces testavorans]
MGRALAQSQTRVMLSENLELLRLSQRSPTLLESLPSGSRRSLTSAFAKLETPELWMTYENLFLACLANSDDKSASECLERITSRFGPANERVMGLRGLYEEALAENETALEGILQGYNTVLKENPVNLPILKRRVALLRSMSRSADASAALVDLLNAFPVDAEAWCELSDLYISQGLHSQAVFCLEEALLISPNAWNLHAKLGEVYYASTTLSDNSETTLRILAESVKRFCRSIELCDNYIRGYYGLHMSTSRLLELMNIKSGSKVSDDIPAQETLQGLQNVSRTKLQDFVTRHAYAVAPNEGQGVLCAVEQLLENPNKAES